MGSLFKPKQPAPPPPAPPTTLRDEVNRVEQVPVTNADGSITYITRALPLTPEQQAERDELNRIMAESLSEIGRLSATDYAPDEATQRVLSQWEERQASLLDRQQLQRTQAEEERLAARGLADSTAAQAVRRQRLLDEQDARQSLSLTRDELGQQIRGDKLALQQNLYNLASSRTDSQAARSASAATRGLSEAVALNASRQASLLDYYTQPNRSVFSDALEGSLGRSVGGTLGGTIGGGFGGPVGRVAGGWLGSWLFGRR